MPGRAAAWYPKPEPIFSDALALVRCRLWLEPTDLTMSLKPPHMPEFQLDQQRKVISFLAYAA